MGIKESETSNNNCSHKPIVPPDKPHSLTILAEPTSDCNLACAYCYKGNKSHKIMSHLTLENMLKKIILYNEQHNLSSSFVWHGGEPTMVGQNFFKKVFDYIDSLNCKHSISHAIQTNGTLLNDPLLDILAEHKVSIGVSLDGIAEYHDRIRPFKKGTPTHHKILEGLQKAKDKNIDIGILMSITNDNIAYITEMFEFCRKNRFTFGINPITADLHSPHSEPLPGFVLFLSRRLCEDRN
ncbi:MAG: uncharacterized protein LiPW30_787 [Parcubacteria group bacterium LiPW_30]|nr:MAG: uncharacterized protein LiPW30_787 [Parcubacteria group bacterium LiPW_30]